MKLDPSFIWTAFLQILGAIPTTLYITVVSVLAGFAIGIVVALVRIYKVPVLYPLAVGYVTFIRGTPMLTHLLLIYFGLPMIIDGLAVQFGWSFRSVSIPMIGFAYISFSITAGAYMSEVVRSGLLAVDRGQIEAAHSIGMSTPRRSGGSYSPGAGGEPAQSVEFRDRNAARVYACFYRIGRGYQCPGANRSFDKLEILRGVSGGGADLLGADLPH